jgi:radical SAM protein with 4Fe4S-binding SPASM domain
MESYPPFTVQIEPVEGCNLDCWFCGIQSVGKSRKAGGLNLMSEDTINSLAYQISELGWNPRLEFAMHGEPTLHPDLPRLIQITRHWLPKSYILVVSNGVGLLKDPIEKLNALFTAGLNTIALDNYNSNKIIDTVLREMTHTEFQIHYYPSDIKMSPHTRRQGRHVIIVEDITTATVGNHATIHNAAGNAGILDHSYNGERCAKPFREISVRWDGNVSICCEDWSGECQVGNITTRGLGAVWDSPEMGAFRRILYQGRRELIPTCAGCSYRSYRTGLLPDRLGRHTLPDPTESDYRSVAYAHSHGALTLRVRPRGAATAGSREGGTTYHG